MRSLTVKHSAFKAIAMIMAMLLLCVQMAAAFHHHHAQTNPKHDTPLNTTLKAKFHSECGICHYMAHQAQSALGRLFSWLFLAGILLAVITALAQRKISRGFRFTTLNKGPPVSFL